MRNEYKYVLQQGYYQFPDDVRWSNNSVCFIQNTTSSEKLQWWEKTVNRVHIKMNLVQLVCIIAFIATHILLSEESTATNYPYLELTLPLLLEYGSSPWFDHRDSVAGAQDLGDLTLRLDEDVRQCGLWSFLSTRFGYQSERSSAWYQTSVKAVYPGWRQVSRLLDARSYRERVCTKVVKLINWLIVLSWMTYYRGDPMQQLKFHFQRI